jgi:hypothetical protein
VVAGIAVDDVHGVDLIETVLLGMGAKDVGHAGIEAAAEHGHDTALLEAVLISPLPLVFELGLVRRFVVRGVQVRRFGFQTGVHDGQVLVRQRHVDHQLGAKVANQRRGVRRSIGIERPGLQRPPGSALDRFGHLLRARHGAARQQDVREHIGQLRTLVRHHTAHTPCADYQNFTHSLLRRCPLCSPLRLSP